MKTMEKTPQCDLLAIGLSLDRVVVKLVSLVVDDEAVVVVVEDCEAVEVEEDVDEVVDVSDGGTHGAFASHKSGVLSSKM